MFSKERLADEPLSPPFPSRVRRGFGHIRRALPSLVCRRRIVVKSLRFRLMMWYGGVLALALMIAARGLYMDAKKLFESRQDMFLALNAYYFVSIAEDGRSKYSDAVKVMQAWDALPGTRAYSYSVKMFPPLPRGAPGKWRGQERRLSYVVYARIVNPQSNIALATSATLQRSPALIRSLETSLRRHKVPVPLHSFSDWDDKQQMLIQTEPLNIGSRTYLLQMAVALNYPNEIMEHIGNVLFTAVPTLVALAMLGGWMLVSRTLQPIGRIVTQARLLDADSLPRQLLAAPQETDSEIGQLVVTLNDMTTRLHQAFEAQRRYAEAKAQFAAAQQRFVADASHELRTPLTILRGEIELALARPREGEKYRATLYSAIEEIGRMGRIVDGLTTLARGDAGALVSKSNFARVDVVDIVVSAVSGFKHQAREQGIPIEVHIKSDSPPCAAARGDAGQLQQVICNLLANALKYTPSGGQVTVAISGPGGEREEAALEPAPEAASADSRPDSPASPPHCVIVEIADTGIGIAAEDLPHIFERFWRADRSRAAGGSGLGLAICAEIVEGHGGVLEVESQLGRGSVFRVELPCAEDT